MMRISVMMSAVLLSDTAITTRGFNPYPHFLKSPKRHLTSHRASDDHTPDFTARNKARTCIRQFLTQRSIQSFMFLLEQCRDPHTVNWMEDFCDSKSILQYHGTGAFNQTLFPHWDSFLLEMMEKPRDRITVSVRKRGRGLGGWSKNNPYLPDRFVDYHIDVNPPSLVSRIMAVREQIAKEWESDMDIVIVAGDLIIDSYFENVEKERTEENEFDEDELDVVPSDKKVSFDRQAMMMLRNRNAFEDQTSSPFRNGSFDLILLLATQESIHRLLRTFMKEGSKKRITMDWLRDFYIERIHYFDGNQRYGRADDFIEELLLTPPSVKQDGKEMVIVDPVGLTERLLRLRGIVAAEWKDTMNEVPGDHIGLRRNLLTTQMVNTEIDLQEKSENENANKEEDSEVEALGEFE